MMAMGFGTVLFALAGIGVVVASTMSSADEWVVSQTALETVSEDPLNTAASVVRIKCVLTKWGAFTPGTQGGQWNPESVCYNPTLGQANKK